MKEKHYTVPELAEMWHRSRGWIRKVFRNELGVQHSPWSGLLGKRSYDDMRIPESVALRVYERLKQPPVKAILSRRELRVVKYDRKQYAA